MVGLEVGARVLRVVITGPRALLDFGDSLGDGFAHLLGHQLRVLPFVLPQHVAGGRERFLALAQRPIAPRLEGVHRSLERGLDVRVVVLGVFGELFASSWLDCLHGSECLCHHPSVLSIHEQSTVNLRIYFEGV